MRARLGFWPWCAVPERLWNEQEKQTPAKATDHSYNPIVC
jgi:hypothetical protein